ncbi:MAG: hypothetical protein WC205_12680 [Opitutaceae bacterium]|jgi:hypothetical protein
MCPPRFHENEMTPGVDSGSIDDVLLRLVPWLAMRHDFADGSFTGKGEEQSAPAGFLTAQATAILAALGLREKLPHIVRAKLDAWPGYPAVELAGPAAESPLALAMRAHLSKNAAVLERELAPFLSSDGGYTLKPGGRRPGLMAAAHYLLVEVRPAWFALRDLPVPPVDETATRHFLSQLFPAFST